MRMYIFTKDADVNVRLASFANSKDNFWKLANKVYSKP
jgi:hypothetical protein